jgi:hypothetical protein
MPVAVSANPSQGVSSRPAGNLFSTTNFSDPSVAGATTGAASASLFGTGSSLLSGGMASLQPVIDHLMKLLSGDPGAVDQAAAPQVARVIDQYDTARKNIAEFSPRGGGTNSALAGSRVQEGRDISDVKNNAITSAISQLAQVGGTELSAGEAASSSGLQGMLQTLQAAIQSKGQNIDLLSSLGGGLGTLLAAFIKRSPSSS